MGYSVTWETGACFSRERRNLERGSSQGNVLSLSYLMAENDEVLRNHLNAPEKKTELTFPRRVRKRLSISSGRTSYRTDF